MCYEMTRILEVSLQSMNRNKIAIVGISGSGKSVFGRELAKKTGLPLFHMDQFFWKGKWEEVPEEEYLTSHQELLKNDRWIIEGFVDVKMDNRVKTADLVLYLDYSGILCAWRVFRRWLKYRKESRPELPEEALERFSFKFLWRILTRKERENIEDALRGVDKSHVTRFRSPKELERFMEKMK